MPTALPPATDYTGASVTQGGKKSFMTAVRTYLAELLGTTGAKSAAIAALGIESSSAIRNLALSAAVASNALTMSVKTRAGSDPSATDVVTVAMRAASSGGGGFTERQAVAALALTVPSGATLGHASGIPGWLYWYLIDNAGTLELAVSAEDFGHMGIVSTSAINSSSSSAYAMYSAAARSSVAFRRIARTRDTQTTAGTWTALPSLIELAPFSLPVQRGAQGQCVLAKVSSNLVLSPLDGNVLSFPAGDAFVPAGGVTLAPSGLTPGTSYYIYAVASAGVVASLEPSTTAPAADAQTGIAVKTGDPTRVLVGFARIITGPDFVDTAAQRFVRSYFHDLGVTATQWLGSDTIIGYSAWGELAAALRCEMLLWAGERVRAQASVTGYEATSGTPRFYAGVGVDSTSSPTGTVGRGVSAGANVDVSVVAHMSWVATEGYHYLALLAGRDNGTNPTAKSGYCGITVQTGGR